MGTAIIDEIEQLLSETKYLIILSVELMERKSKISFAKKPSRAVIAKCTDEEEKKSRAPQNQFRFVSIVWCGGQPWENSKWRQSVSLWRGKVHVGKNLFLLPSPSQKEKKIDIV